MMATQTLRSSRDPGFGADLTSRQRMIFDFLVEYVDAHGYPPTVREIGEFFAIRSTNGVHDHLRALEKKGYVTREDKASRGLTLAKPPTAAQQLATQQLATQTSPTGATGVLEAARSPAEHGYGATGPATPRRPARRPRPNATPALMVTRAGADPERAQAQAPRRGGGRAVAILGRVAAGMPIPAVQDADDVIELDERLTGSGDVFALRVVGRSMIDAGILPEDLVLVAPTPRVDNGRIAVVDVDGEVTVKRFYQEANGVRLVAENREMAPIVLDAAAATRLRVIGQVRGVVRSLR
jgi:repressor LexA